MKMMQKSLSVLLAVLMLSTCCIPAFNGSAAQITYSAQYTDLAALLSSEYVRSLEHYEITNKKSDDMITEGFNQDAGAFAYEHIVYAKDNTENEILRAANRFYYIAESLISYTYGRGVYSPELLFKVFMQELEPYFEDVKSEGYFDMDNQPYAPTLSEQTAYEYACELLAEQGLPVNKENLAAVGQYFIYNDDAGFYVDSYGERYYPTDEELAAFDAAVAALAELGVTDYSINDFYDYDLSFVRVTPFQYYNVEAIITYFMGTGDYTNAGNWYHDFVFIVESDVETMLLEMESLDNFPSSSITITTGIYRFRYNRSYALNGVAAQYAYKPCNLGEVYIDFHEEYNLGTSPAAISYLEEDENAMGQAANLYTAVSYDEDTISYLRTVNEYFRTAFAARPASEYVGAYYIGDTWDSTQINFTTAQLTDPTFEPAKTTRNYASSLTSLYSNDVVVHLFGDTIGNIKTSEYLLTPVTEMPSRTVRGTATYNLTAAQLNAVVGNFDALFTNEDVMSVVNTFLGDTLNELLAGTTAEGMVANTGQDLVQELLTGLLYSDDMVTLVVSKLYPLIANALVGLFEGAGAFSGLLEGLLSWAIESLGLALTPAALGDMLDDYPSPQAALRAAGNGYTDWENVDWEGVVWTTASGVPLNNQLTFINAFVATFRGLKEALLCLMKEEYNLSLLTGSVNLESQDSYEKLIVPLFQVFGLSSTNVGTTEYNGRFYYSVDAYESRAVSNNDKYLTDILQPLLYWAENVLAVAPISTVCSLLPNLVNFLIRDTNSLTSIARNIIIQITLAGSITTVYEISLYDILGDTAKSLDSLNHILDAFVELSTADGVAYKLPKFHEKKLLECGTLRPDNTINVDNPGLVLLYLLRYVFTAIGYRYDVSNPDLPYLLECFGLDIHMPLFGDLKLSELIFNIMLHPDEALCALLELFYPNEDGDYYNNEPYTYPLEPINYYTNTLLNDVLNPSLGYGAPVKYSEYWTRENATEVARDIGPLADNILKILGVEGFENGLGGFLENLIYGYITDETVNMLFNIIYQLLSGADGSIDFDLAGMLSTLLDVEFSPQGIATRIEKMLGFRPPAYDTLMGVFTWEELFTTQVYNPDTGEYDDTLTDVSLAWGVDDARANGLATGEAFIRVLSALLSPAAVVLEFLFLDQDIKLLPRVEGEQTLGLITIPGYAGYQYALIALLEVLSCPAGDIMTYGEYYTATLGNPDHDLAECNTVYGILKPILGLLDKVCADPITTVMNLVPNLMFFLSIGALNDLLNNLVHFAYVLLDIVKPVLNGYDIINSLLANLQVGGMSLNLSVPLDIDLNALISTLLAELLDETIVLTTVDVKDGEGNVIGTKDVSITLPYIDFYTLCAGKLEKFQSAEGRKVVHMGADGGGDFLTAAFRLLVSVFFLDENLEALSSLLFSVGSSLDDYDRETINLLLAKLTGVFGEYDTEDIVLMIVHILVTKLTDVSGELLGLLDGTGIKVLDLINAMGNIDSFRAYIDAIMNGTLVEEPTTTEPPVTQDPQSGGGVPTIDAGLSYLDKVRAFFAKIILFFRTLFGF